MITVKTIADCPSYKNQAAPQPVKDWLLTLFPNGEAAPGIPKEAPGWFKRVADNTQALNEACQSAK